MALSTAAEPVPFHVLENGAARLNGSRMALEAVIQLYKGGMSAEEIHNDFNAPLAEVHASIAYYLRHTDEVDEYLAECERKSAEFDAKYRDPEAEKAFANELRRRWAERNGRNTL